MIFMEKTKESKKNKKEKSKEDAIYAPLAEGATLQVNQTNYTYTKNNKTYTKTYNSKILNLNPSQNQVAIKIIGKPTRRKTAQAYSVKAHIRNFNQGTQEEYSKELQVIYAHFPVTIEVKNSTVYIKNFLGEKQPRVANIHGNAKVEVNGQTIKIKGHNKEDVGQTANNLRRATRITNKDNRIFQDGIYYS